MRVTDLSSAGSSQWTVGEDTSAMLLEARCTFEEVKVVIRDGV